MAKSNTPKSCDECYDELWCDDFYGVLVCKYEISRKKEMLKEKDDVKEPSHYKQGRFETIDEMIIVFGPQKTRDFCIMNAWKYRSRAPYKENQEKDMRKSDEYLEIAREIENKNEHLFFGGATKLIKE